MLIQDASLRPVYDAVVAERLSTVAEDEPIRPFASDAEAFRFEDDGLAAGALETHQTILRKVGLPAPIRLPLALEAGDLAIDGGQVLMLRLARHFRIALFDAVEAAIALVKVDEEVFVAPEAELRLIGALGLASHTHRVGAVVLMLLNPDAKLTEVGEAGYFGIYRVVLLNELLRIHASRCRVTTSKRSQVCKEVFLVCKALSAGVFTLIPDGRIVYLFANAACLALEDLGCGAFEALLTDCSAISFERSKLLDRATEKVALHFKQVSFAKVRLLWDRIDAVSADLSPVLEDKVLLMALAANLHAHGASSLAARAMPQVLVDQPQGRRLAKHARILDANHDVFRWPTIGVVIVSEVLFPADRASLIGSQLEHNNRLSSAESTGSRLEQLRHTARLTLQASYFAYIVD